MDVQRLKEQAGEAPYRTRLRKFQKSSGRYTALCPFHNDHNPSLSVYRKDSVGVWLWKCFTCQTGGDVLQFVQDFDHVDFKQAIQTIADECGISIQAPTPIRAVRSFHYDRGQALTNIEKAKEFLAGRGIPLELAQEAGVGYCNHPTLGPAVALHYDDQIVKFRALNPTKEHKFLHLKGRPSADRLYGIETLDDVFTLDGDVCVTESELDSLTLRAHGFYAVSVSSASACLNADGTLKIVPEELARLERADSIFLALDMDAPGQKCADAFARLLNGRCYRLNWPYGGKDSADPKDIGEVFAQSGDKFADRLQQLKAEAISRAETPTETPTDIPAAEAKAAVIEIREPAVPSFEVAPAYPVEVLDGDFIGELTHCLGDGTPLPPQFIREQIKTALGAIINGRVGYPNQKDMHTRQYNINISNYPGSGKSESWKRVGDYNGHLRGVLDENKIEAINGGLFGSGQYMVRVLEASVSNGSRGQLAYFDEIVEAFQKTKQEGSTLEAGFLTLYDSNSIATGSFKNKQFQADNVHLSFSGNTTREGFERSFEGRGCVGSGFLSRCVLTYADRLAHEGDWAETNVARAQEIVRLLHDCIPSIPTGGTGLFDGPLILEEDPEAKEARLAFQRMLADPALLRFSARLEFHTKRDALLRAVFSKERRITKEHMEKTIKWGWHQLELRQLLWPEDAGSVVEIMERKILNVLQKYGPQSNRDLIRRCNVNRPRSGGHEVFGRALRALVFNSVIHVVEQTRKLTPVYALVA